MISTHGLTRAFDGVPAVEDVSFDVPAGTLFALLGPNGAGKTTTVRMLMGLIGPTAGGATVAGYRIGAGADAGRLLRRACGLLTEAPGFYDRMSAGDNLRFFGRLYGLPERTLRQQIEHFLRLLELWDRRDAAVGTFSKGMKQRLAIIRALFHDPKVVFLDEPTAGLDPEAALEVRELIARLKTEGRTIVVCTHNLDEAERLADAVGILRRRLLVCDSLERLRAGPGGDGRLTVQCTLDGPAATARPRAPVRPAGTPCARRERGHATLTARCLPDERAGARRLAGEPRRRHPGSSASRRTRSNRSTCAPSEASVDSLGRCSCSSRGNGTTRVTTHACCRSTSSCRSWPSPCPILLALMAPTHGAGTATERRSPPRSPWLQSLSRLSEFQRAAAGEALARYVLRATAGMFLLMPIAIASTAAAFSIVGEKQQRTLEPILATPITDRQLLLGKLLACVGPTVARHLGGGPDRHPGGRSGVRVARHGHAAAGPLLDGGPARAGARPHGRGGARHDAALGPVLRSAGDGADVGARRVADRFCLLVAVFGRLLTVSFPGAARRMRPGAAASTSPCSA